MFIYLNIDYLFINLSLNDKSTNSSQMGETFGEYIKHLRNNNKLTLTQLAAKLDMDSANLCKVENGKREFDEKRLLKLANVFYLDLEKLKEEYFSEKIAKKLYENNCSENTLFLAEQKVKYLKQINSKQGKLNL